MRRAVSRAAFVLSLLLSAGVVHAQTVDEIVAKNLEAKGGEKFKAVNTVRMTGKVIMHAIGGIEAPLTTIYKRPNLMRQEFTVKDQPMVQAYDGTTGWMSMAGMTQDLPPQATEVMKRNDFDGPLANYKERGHTVELVGKEKVGDAETYHLKVTMKDGPVQHYYLDTTTWLEVRKSEEVPVGPQGMGTLHTDMADYKPVDGLMMPHSFKQVVDGKVVAEMAIEKVEINPTLDDALFKRPAK